MGRYDVAPAHRVCARMLELDRTEHMPHACMMQREGEQLHDTLHAAVSMGRYTVSPSCHPHPHPTHTCTAQSSLPLLFFAVMPEGKHNNPA